MLKVSFARLVLLCVLITGAAQALAQNCGGAVPEFDYQPQACPNGTAGAYARFGPPPNWRWDSYQWSISAGTIVSGANSESMQYVAPAGGTVDITLTVAGGSGCGGTITHTVAVTSEQNAMIMTDSAICPTSLSGAAAMYGNGTPGAVYSWSITNGTLYGPANGPNVQYISGASGSVHLSVDVTTPNNCNGHGTVDVPIQQPSATIETWGIEAACPDRVTSASLITSSYGTNVVWSATHAHIIGSPMEPSVSFVPDGTGDVTLTALGTNTQGCAVTATRTLPLQAAVAPELVPGAATVCPNGDVSVSVTNANAFQNFTWSITGGSLSPSWPQTSATIHANGAGSVRVRVRVRGRLISGCETESSLEIPIRLPDAEVHAPATVCPNTSYVVSVADAGAGASYVWDVTGGSLVATNGNEATIAAGPAGTPRASVSVQSGACGSTGFADTNVVDGALNPTIHTSGSTCVGTTTASVDNAANYATYAWQISNGFIDSAANGPSITYHATSSADVTLSVHVTGGSCAGDATKTVPGVTTPAPMIGFSPPSMCGTNGTITATLMNAPSYASADWSVENAVIEQRSEWGDWITIRPTGGAAAVTTVDARAASGCTVTGSATVPTTEPVAPILLSTPSTHCGAGSPVTVQITNASVFDTDGMHGYAWVVRNGFVQGSTYGSSIVLIPTSSADVEVSVVATYNSYACRGYGSITIPGHAAAQPVITLSAPEVCPNGSGTASVLNTPGSYYSWSVQHGWLTSNSWESSVDYRADGTGPVTLTVQSSSDGCQTSASVTVPLKSIPPPVITLDQPEVCPNGGGSASVATTYGGYSWQIEHGWLMSNSWESSVTYRADGTGPVKLSVMVWSNDYCQASSNVTVPLKSIPPPVITLDQPEVCPNGGGSASVPATYGGYSWQIEHGTIMSTSWESSVTYRADGTGPVKLSVMVWSNDYCQASSNVTVPLKSIPPPVITLDQPEVCPNGGGSASVPATYGGYSWQIEHGTIMSTSWESSVTYRADGSGPVKLSVMVWSNDYCQASSNVTVPLKSIPPPVITLDQPEVCPNGGGSASVPATYGGYSWQIEHGTIMSTSWESSVTYRADGTGPVKLSVMVWSNDYCQASSDVTIPLKSIPPPAITLDQPEVCPNGGGSASVPATYGGYSWQIEHGTILSASWESSVTYRADGSGPVKLSVMVWSNDYCQASSDVIVPLHVVPTPTITAGGPTTFCEGGSVTLTASAGSAYLWSTGETTRAIVAGMSGAYSVTVTDASGCSATSAATNVVRETAPVIDITAPASTCEGATSTASVSGASGATILWSATNATITGGQGTPTITFAPSTAGTVDLGVSVTSGTCTVSASKSVAVNALPEFALDVRASGTYDLRAGDGETSALRSEDVQSNAMHDFCGATAVSLTATVLDPTWTYVWSTGATGPHILVNAGGTYTLTATNAAGCSYSQTETVVMNPAPVASISGALATCPGGSTTLTASGGTSYLWNNGATTPSITVTQAGTYSVTATSNSCSASASASVTEVAASIAADGPTTFCHGGSVTLSAAAAQSYLWSNGATTQSITVSESGAYSVAETFTAGCTLNATPVVVTVGPASVAIAANRTSVCPNDAITFTSTITGGSNLTLQWLDGNGAPIAGANGATLVLTPQQPGYGSVSLRATDANGCAVTSAALTYYRLDPPKPVITPSRPSTTFCQGGNITLESSAGAAYLWSTGATTRSITVAQSGAYTVTVTDASGCHTPSDPMIVTVLPTPAAPVITADGPLTFCEGGSVRLTGPDGYAQYSWSTGETTQSIVVSTSRFVSLSVVNASGCDATSEVQVTVNPNPGATITAGGPLTFCAGGSVTLTAPAGFTYVWSNGATAQSIVANASGAYSVTVTNASGCSATSAATNVTVNAAPATPTITAGGPTTFCAGGSVTLTAPAGFTYLWSNGATTQSIVANASGAYSVTVTNANGCSATSAATHVTVNAAPATPTITANGPTTFCAGGSVTLTAPAGFTYVWSNGATTRSIAATTTGAYSVTVTNASGCSSTSTAANVTVNAKPATPTITAGGPTTFCAGGSVTLTAPAGFTYLWSNGATTQSIVANASGAYSVTVTNASGCSATSTAANVTVNAKPATPTITAGGPTTFCAGGSVTLTAPAGFTYLWSNGATTQSIVANASGAYSVTVTNASGCSATSAVTNVTVNAAPATPTITAGGPTTFCAGGSVTLTAPAGFTYLWSNGATTQSIVATTTGAYSVTVTNASGCSTTSAATNVTVNAAPAVPAITPSGSTALCPGASVTLTAPAGFTYLWSNGATTRAITVSAAGSYSVTVTNAGGCSRTSAPTAVTANPATVITVQPADKTLARNTTWRITMTATGTSTLTYQWYNGTSPTTTSPIAGATNSYLDIGPFSKKTTARYWVRVSSSTCTASTVNSNTATITVN